METWRTLILAIGSDCIETTVVCRTRMPRRTFFWSFFSFFLISFLSPWQFVLQTLFVLQRRCTHSVSGVDTQLVNHRTSFKNRGSTRTCRHCDWPSFDSEKTTYIPLNFRPPKDNGDFHYWNRIRIEKVIDYLKDHSILLHNGENPLAYRYWMFVYFSATGYNPPEIGVWEIGGFFWPPTWN